MSQGKKGPGKQKNLESFDITVKKVVRKKQKGQQRLDWYFDKQEKQSTGEVRRRGSDGSESGEVEVETEVEVNEGAERNENGSDINNWRVDNDPEEDVGEDDALEERLVRNSGKQTTGQQNITRQPEEQQRERQQNLEEEVKEVITSRGDKQKRKRERQFAELYSDSGDSAEGEEEGQRAIQEEELDKHRNAKKQQENGKEKETGHPSLPLGIPPPLFLIHICIQIQR